MIFCSLQGFQLAATQAGAHCFCGDEGHDRYGKVASNRCVSLCTGKNTQACGGSLVNQVYSTSK